MTAGGLYERLCRHAREQPDEAALVEVESGVTWTWRRLEEEARAVADGLRGRREAVLLCRDNGVEYVAEFLGILAAGCDALCVSPHFTAAERKSLCDAAADVERAGAVLLPSSGTTGMPKIVRRSGASLAAMAEAICNTVGFAAEDHVLAAAPLCHSYGMEHGLLAPIWAGACTHLCRRFDAGVVARELAGEMTIFPGVPFMFEAIVQAGSSARRGALRRAYSAGGPLSGAAGEAFLEKYAVGVGQVYGATEVGSVTFGDQASPGNVGRALPGASIRVDEQTSQVSVRSAWMMEGYLGCSPAEHLAADGFFLTGDLGKWDGDGNLILTGRAKLMIDVGGRKVNPLEVESVLAAHPQVGQCVVVAMPLEGSVTRLKALVTPRSAAGAISAAELRRYVKQRLAAYKVPRVFEVRDQLPASPTGKILRHLIQE